MNKKIVKVIACAMSVAMLAACGKTGDKMSFEFDGNTYGMDKRFTDFIAETVGAGYEVLDVNQFKFYNEDGTYSDRNISKEKNLERDKLFIVGDINCNGPDKIGYSVYLDRDYENLNNYKSADGITIDSKPEDLPEEFVELGTYNYSWYSRKNDVTNDYMVLVKDGKYVNLQEYIDKLPTKADDEFADKLVQISQDSYTSGFYPLLPEYIVIGGYSAAGIERENFTGEYNDDSFKNVCAVILALNDLYSEFEAGEIESFGTISYAYVDDDMVSCLYSVINEKK